MNGLVLNGEQMIYGLDFNAVDIGLLVLVLLELLLGLRRGLAGTAFRLLSTLVILLAALRFYQPFGRLLTEHTTLLVDNPELAGALAFLLIVVTGGLCFLALRWILRTLLTISFNEKINSPIGGFVGALQGLALGALIIYAAGLWPQASSRQLFVQTSFAGRSLFQVSPRLITAIEQFRFCRMPMLTTPEKLQ